MGANIPARAFIPYGAESREATLSHWSNAMRSKEQFADQDLFQRTVTVLLAACVLLMAASTTVTWSYLAAISREITVATSGQAESVRALSAMNGQQTAANLTLDAVRGETNLNLRAIRDELQALNQKASVAGDVKPPQSQP